MTLIMRTPADIHYPIPIPNTIRNPIPNPIPISVQIRSLFFGIVWGDIIKTNKRECC